MKDVRTWIEIDRNALHHNVEQFFRLIPKETQFMAVIKSNAYGHGLAQVAKLLAEFRISNLESRKKAPNSKFQIPNSRLWFGVDSIVEALRLRREAIANPILVLGFTLPSRMAEATKDDITLCIANFESLSTLADLNEKPAFHIKMDTGMHRQGFQTHELPKLISLLKKNRLAPSGLFTHFASAKDVCFPTYTCVQLEEFYTVIKQFEKAGYTDFTRHAAASGGTLLFPQSHLQMVRVGMGMYGYWPSQEAKMHCSLPAELKIKNEKVKVLELKPVLTWKTIISEIKEIPDGSFIGYDLTERVHRHTKIAVLPIGYWHGYDRGLSSIGEVLVRGVRTRVLGRISMDMIVVDVTNAPEAQVGDEVVLIGKQGKEEIWADELAAHIGTSPYEFLTRINPLIRRVIV